jgi:hypothetical protein
MLSWVVDNLPWVLLGLGIVALCFAAVWWTTRKDKLLIGVAVPGVLMLAAWLLSLVIVTDRMQLVSNVESMRDLVNNGKLTDAVQHFDEVVEINGIGGPQTYKKATLEGLAKFNMRQHNIKKVVTNKIEIEDIVGDKATVTFFIGSEDSSERGRCIMGFVKSPDGKWRVNNVKVVTPIGDHPLPVLFPLF